MKADCTCALDQEGVCVCVAWAGRAIPGVCLGVGGGGGVCEKKQPEPLYLVCHTPKSYKGTNQTRQALCARTLVIYLWCAICAFRSWKSV